MVVDYDKLGELIDGWTFGLLLLCIWASQGSKWWTFCTALMFLAFMLVKAAAVVGKRKHEFKGIEDLHAWVEQERYNAELNGGCLQPSNF